MNAFDRRWKQAVEVARLASQTPLPEKAPLGFSTRVLARWPAGREPSLASLWQVLSMRVLGAMALILFVCLAYQGISSPPDSLASPELESAVTDTFALP
jgi:hypothetical protein